MLATTLTINQFAKTPEGMALIAEQKPFILGGVIYQGYEGAVPSCSEKLLTDDEIASATDVDGTRERVLKTRQLRMHGRHDRKATEYRERRATLRGQRNEIIESMEKSEKRGVQPSPADLEDIADIDAKMERLSSLSFGHKEASAGVKAPKTDAEVLLQTFVETIPGFDPSAFGSPEEALQVAKDIKTGRSAAPDPPPPPDAEPEPTAELDPDKVLADVAEAMAIPVKCDVCEKVSPPGRKDTARWLHAHKMGAHKNPRKKG